jgi:calcineurin-like phosphoesterase family protein
MKYIYNKTIVPADKFFATADTHYGHKNVIRLCNRPFKDIDEMNEALIKNWNAIVPEDGHVFHLGDVGFKGKPEKLREMLNRLNGKIYLIMGNHERDAMDSKCIGRFEWVEKYQAVWADLGNGILQEMFLCHYAMTTWNKSHTGRVWQLYGHSHGNLPEVPNMVSFDVGVDCWNYEPVSFAKISEKMATKQHIDRQIHKQEHNEK